MLHALKNWLSHRRPSRPTRDPRLTRLGLETLEAREVPSASPLSSPAAVSTPTQAVVSQPPAVSSTVQSPHDVPAVAYLQGGFNFGYLDYTAGTRSPYALCAYQYGSYAEAFAQKASTTHAPTDWYYAYAYGVNAANYAHYDYQTSGNSYAYNAYLCDSSGQAEAFSALTYYSSGQDKAVAPTTAQTSASATGQATTRSTSQELSVYAYYASNYITVGYQNAYYSYTEGNHNFYALYAYVLSYYADYYAKVAISTGELNGGVNWYYASAYAQQAAQYAQLDYQSTGNGYAYNAQSALGYGGGLAMNIYCNCTSG